MTDGVKAPKVALARERDLPWLELKDTPGFNGQDIPGVTCKFFGQEGVGPWFYLVHNEPHTHNPKHKPRGDFFHYILEGTWEMGGRTLDTGSMHFEQKGLYYGPFSSGPDGSLFLAIYDHEPAFVER
jgi:hypothetical protein